MHHFTTETTSGYTGADLHTLNARMDLACVSHLSGSVYDDKDVLDIAAWITDDPDGYQMLKEHVLRNYDTEVLHVRTRP